MDGTLSSSPVEPALPSDLFLRILSLLPPKDLAFSGRLVCKDAQRFTEREHRTVTLDQPLPSHVVTNITTASAGTSTSSTNEATCAATTFAPGLLDSAEASLRELTFRRKLLLLSRAAASGCEVNCSFAWQLLQPHVFLELMQSDFYRRFLAQEGQEAPVPDVGSAAVASGLAHLLPSLVQRCPGLLDPGRTLEAAAQHCDLAELQAAWGLLEQRLQSSLEEEGGQLPGSRTERVHRFWQRMLAGAAGSTAPEATSKMEWVLANAPAACNRASILAHACGAAAASGDLARVRWLRERGVDWGSLPVLEAAVQHASMGCIQHMEEVGGYLPAARSRAWYIGALVNAAAAAPQDSVAKLRWLADKGVSLSVGGMDARATAAKYGNLEALQMLLDCQHPHRAPPNQTLDLAAFNGHVATAAWLRQAGCTLTKPAFCSAFRRGDLPMVRWLLEAGGPRDQHDSVALAISHWPRSTAADGQRLVEAVRLLAAAGWPMKRAGDKDLLTTAACAGHPWAVWRALLDLYHVAVPRGAVVEAASTGCWETLEALAGMNAGRDEDDVYEDLYAHAAKSGDKGTLAWLRRRGLPLESGEVLTAFVEGAPAPALRWLVEQAGPLQGWEIHHLKRNLGLHCMSCCSKQEQKEVKSWLMGCLAVQLRQRPIAKAALRAYSRPEATTLVPPADGGEAAAAGSAQAVEAGGSGSRDGGEAAAAGSGLMSQVGGTGVRGAGGAGVEGAIRLQKGVSSCVSDASGLAAACGAHEEAVADKRLEISAPPLRVRNAFASASAANPPSGSFEDTLAGWLYVVAWALVALLAYVFYLQA